MFIAEFTSSELTKCGPEDVAETSNSTREIAVSKLSMLIADEIWSMYRVASCSVFDQIGITKLRCATRHWPWSYNFFLCKLRRSNIVCSCHKSENTINENNFFLRYSVTFLPSLSCIFFCQFLYVFCCSMLQVIIIVFFYFSNTWSFSWAMLFFSFFWLFRPNVVHASHQEESGSVDVTRKVHQQQLHNVMFAKAKLH
jgi:hypothetical protein